MKSPATTVLLILAIQGYALSSPLNYSIIGSISNSNEDVIATDAFRKYPLYGLSISGEALRRFSAAYGIKMGIAYAYKRSDSFMYSYGLSYIQVPLSFHYETPFNVSVDAGGRLNYLIRKSKGYKTVNQCTSQNQPAEPLPRNQGDTTVCSDRELKTDIEEPYIHYNSTFFDALLNLNYSYYFLGLKNTIRISANIGLTNYRKIRKVDFGPYYSAEVIQFNNKNEGLFEVGLGYGFGF